MSKWWRRFYSFWAVLNTPRQKQEPVSDLSQNLLIGKNFKYWKHKEFSCLIKVVKITRNFSYQFKIANKEFDIFNFRLKCKIVHDPGACSSSSSSSSSATELVVKDEIFDRPFIVSYIAEE